MSLRELYQEIIVDHGKMPRNFGKLVKASHSKMGHNPLCGDRLILYLIVRDSVVEDVRFEGVGCAISVASASLMTEAVKGKTICEIETLFSKFHALVTEGNVAEGTMGKSAVFAGVKAFPVRVKCATLAWHTLKSALQNDPKPVSTE